MLNSVRTGKQYLSGRSTTRAMLWVAPSPSRPLSNQQAKTKLKTPIVLEYNLIRQPHELVFVFINYYDFEKDNQQLQPQNNKNQPLYNYIYNLVAI